MKLAKQDKSEIYRYVKKQTKGPLKWLCKVDDYELISLDHQ